MIVFGEKSWFVLALILTGSDITIFLKFIIDGIKLAILKSVIINVLAEKLIVLKPSIWATCCAEREPTKETIAPPARTPNPAFNIESIERKGLVVEIEPMPLAVAMSLIKIECDAFNNAFAEMVVEVLKTTAKDPINVPTPVSVPDPTKEILVELTNAAKPASVADSAKEILVEPVKTPDPISVADPIKTTVERLAKTPMPVCVAEPTKVIAPVAPSAFKLDILADSLN